MTKVTDGKLYDGRKKDETDDRWWVPISQKARVVSLVVKAMRKSRRPLCVSFIM